MTAPVVLVTGALTGIGRATALAFAKEGATVVAAGRRESEGKALEADLRDLGAQAAFIQADVRREDDVRNLVDQTVARFNRLDVAVNNAGTEGKPGPVTEQTPNSYTSMFDTNVLGTLLSLKHELRIMQPQRSGSIVNISSTMGERGAANLALYTASKRAVEGLTKCPLDVGYQERTGLIVLTSNLAALDPKPTFGGMRLSSASSGNIGHRA
jgi:NAD(P)-dependent dehydrogenase (short-subunit alcohol dehydrogenase family)